MKEVPEIDPVVRGMIEELVADPRSSIRLAPRRALLPWLDSGDTIATSDVSHTKLERHLIAVHREAVASLLQEASKIAYFKAPVLSHLPRDSEGNPFDVGRSEKSWTKRAASRVRTTHADEGVELLRQCINGIDPGRGYDLARASLSLVPTDEARIAIAGHLKTTEPMFSLHIFERVSRTAVSGCVRVDAWTGAAGRLCALGNLNLAADSYERVQAEWPTALLYRINLGCFLGRPELAIEAGRLVGHMALESDHIEEVLGILSTWSRGLTPGAIKLARYTFSHIQERLPDAAQRIGEAYA